ncbi:TonB-dependent receptor [Fusobacterium varium]|uniref:TonB-dependent receptor n=1 Tax=Fusobacterium varium ATCC 27725 TaxID=469618 RepID=A0ABN5JJK8_FUSVA|nr:TonB-dependent receptor [Fusobacterium varium]AVQ31842.1 TonB-dependent receptor [Fusobacterium varium ATCC 27725]EES63197.1 TonB-dependent receptor [Fusobacterium varium ATCC 27725]VEH39316.1 Colicin I receptor precursor [Fusobacterium varium]
MSKKTALLWAVLAATAYGEQNVDLGKSVIYSTTGFETEMRKTASNPSVVTSKEIKERNYQTVDQILNDIPSINIVKQGKDSIIDLRGQGDKAKQNVQILVDGVQMNSLDTSMTATPINTIAVDNIERIEVLPGGGSVLYGSGTSGGVVNIITKRGTGRTATVGFDHGRYGSNKTNVAVGESFGNFDVNLTYTKNDREGYRDYDKSDSDYFQGDIRYRISDTQNIGFKYSKYKADETYPEMLTRAQVEDDRKQSGLIDGEHSKTKTDKDEYVLTYNNKFTENLDLNLVLFSQETEMKIHGRSYQGAMGPMKLWMTQEALFRDKKKGIKSKLRYAYGEGSSVIFGLEYIDNDAKRKSLMNMPPMMNNILTVNDLTKETISGFVMNNYVWGNFEFAQGVRYERADYKVKRTSSTGPGIDTTTDEDNFAYEVSANYLYSDTGKTYIRYERGFTSPPPALLTNKNAAGYYLNNLKSEKYDNFEIGVSDYIGFTSLNASVFYTITKDEITSETSGTMGSASMTIDNYNLGKTERVGFELKAEQYIDKLTLSQSYAYINAKIKDGEVKGVDVSGNRVANVPRNKFNIGANYAFTNRFNVGGEVVYIDDVYLNNKNLGGKKNSHVVTNIRANYNFDFGLSLHAGINNVFDKKYYEDVDYTESTGTFTYDPAAERNYYVGFRYSL